MENKAFLTVEEVAAEMGVSKSYAYKIVKKLNEELQQMGYAATKEQAQKDISEDGYWGVKQTQQRLFDFASALAGDDVEQMKKMQAAMEKGFKQATKTWGRDLPSISRDTMAAANKIFDEYYKSKESSVQYTKTEDEVVK